jgi:hypothetical protein
VSSAPRRISLAEASRRAAAWGGFGALSPLLCEGRLKAHAKLMSGGQTTQPYGAPIPPEWWRTSRDIDPERSRADFPAIMSTAVDIEIEADEFDSLFPVPEEATPSTDPAASAAEPPNDTRSTAELPNDTAGRIARALMDVYPDGRQSKRVAAMIKEVEAASPDLKPIGKRTFEAALKLLAERDFANWPKRKR